MVPAKSSGSPVRKSASCLSLRTASKVTYKKGMKLLIDCPSGTNQVNTMREDKTTNVSITVEIAGQTVVFQQQVNNHELQEGTIALLNSVMLLASNLNDE
jgi:hypothetical protein